MIRHSRECVATASESNGSELYTTPVGKEWGKLPGSDCSGVWQSGAKVSSTRPRSPWVNLRWSLRVGAWNVLSLREDDHLSLL